MALLSNPSQNTAPEHPAPPSLDPVVFEASPDPVVAPPSPDPVPASFVATGPLLLPLLLVAELLLLVAPPVAPDVPELPLLAVESPLALVPALDEAVNVLEALPSPVSLEPVEL
jgi:hypothetical protein